MNIEINPPIKIGDKVWMSKNERFSSCNFLERYTQYQEYTVNAVSFKYNMKTNSIEWYFQVEGKDLCYLYTDKVAFSKEKLYESFREEIETLIPKEIRDYLWQEK